MVRNIIPEGVNCLFVRQAEQLGLGDAILMLSQRLAMNLAVLLADDFIVNHNPVTTAELVTV